jgi:hypothetical protein
MWGDDYIAAKLLLNRLGLDASNRVNTKVIELGCHRGSELWCRVNTKADNKASA